MGYAQALLMRPLPCEAGEGWGGGERDARASALAPLPTSPRRRGEGPHPAHGDLS
jgi:hypothetical protein